MTSKTTIRLNRIGSVIGAIFRLLAACLLALVGLTPVSGHLLDALAAGQVAHESGDYAAAAAAYRQAYLYEPEQVNHLAAVVEAEVDGGDYVPAEADLTLLASLRPLTTRESSWWGIIYAGQGRTDEAMAAWEATWQEGTIGPAELGELANLYLERQKWAPAEAALSGLAALGVASGPQLLQLGYLEALDSPDKAVTHLAAAAQADASLAPDAAQVLSALDNQDGSDPALIHTRLGIAFYQIGEQGLARMALDRAVLENPLYADAVAYDALVRAQAGDPALGAAEQAAALAPDDPLILYLVGLVWKAESRPHEARTYLTRAFELEPDNPAFAVEIASTHRAEGDLGLADIWMSEAVRLAPNDYRFRLLQAQFYVDEGYRIPDRGLPLSQALANDYPDRAETWATLSWALYQTGDIAGAFDAVDRALNLDPTLPRALFSKGAVLESQGRLDEAVTYYAEAAQSGTDTYFGLLARRALERISGQ